MCVRVCKVRLYVGQSFPLGYICGEVCPNQISDAVRKHRRCDISTTGGVSRRKINKTVMRASRGERAQSRNRR